jgi:beta-lactamase class A
MATRRTFLSGAIALVAASGCTGTLRHRDAAAMAELEAIHARIGGRLGVYVTEMQSAHLRQTWELAYHAHERFAMCSTFKLLLAGAILARVETGELTLDQKVPLSEADMISHAPVTASRVAAGSISVGELCAAVIEVSDNPAANLLLRLIDGPAGLTRYLRGIGDSVTRLDRYELDLNTNLPGDPRDTTTPHAMVRSVQALLTGDVLNEESRTRLIQWLRGSQTGLGRIRAGLPAEWQAGDKTGTGANGAANDVMVAWPAADSVARGSLICAAVYMSESKEPRATLERAHADIGTLIARRLTSS